MTEKLHLPGQWKFQRDPTAPRAYHGEFVLWALKIPAAAGPSWSAGISDGGGLLVRVARASTKAKAIAAVEGAAVAGGWMLPREGKEKKHGSEDA